MKQLKYREKMKKGDDVMNNKMRNKRRKRINI
jgi:hypothetical protein